MMKRYSEWKLLKIWNLVVVKQDSSDYQAGARVCKVEGSPLADLVRAILRVPHSLPDDLVV